VKTEKLSIEYLHECFNYNYETGILRWKTRPRKHFIRDVDWRRWNTQNAGNEAGREKQHGNRTYRIVCISSRQYMVHRVAFAMFHGEWPENQVDHFDGNGLNNRPSNLRPSDTSLNLRNSHMYSNNKSGFNGVHWNKIERKWEVHININKKPHYLGRFADIESAIKVRVNAEQSHGYTNRHGVAKR
jgi:hypothetical protein